MEQALTKCKCNSGPYVVLPVISGVTTRAMLGKLLDTSLNPTTYVGTPILAMVKAGLTVNRTSFIQPLIKLIEENYADPYEIARKMYGINYFIKAENLDRKEILENGFKQPEELPPDVNPELVRLPDLKASSQDDLKISEIVNNNEKLDDILVKNYISDSSKLLADKVIFDYNPQSPVIDSMRTALFDLPDINNSIWNELSVWNRSFSNKIKTSSVNITPDRENYKFRYIMQKDKTAPVIIIYPSIGEGIESHHSTVFAKLFYDAGYSVIIQGSHFQWEFVKSMPANYRPGLPNQDVVYLRDVTSKIIDKLENKYECKFSSKTVFGTSLGAMATLFLADKEYRENTLGISKYISVCPPIELFYAIEQIDKNGEEWQKNPNDLKNRVAQTASKIVQLYDMKDSSKDFQIGTLPFSEEEGKLITGFVMHQKLSDLVFTLENTPQNKPTEIYNTINNMNYRDYAQKYLMTDKTEDEVKNETNLLSLSDFLKNSSNYKIYHSVDDYLVNQNQLKNLKLCSGKKTTLMSNGAHLGFMYTPEFIEDLKKEIAQNE
jgi:hypothetical protein